MKGNLIGRTVEGLVEFNVTTVCKVPEMEATTTEPVKLTHCRSFIFRKLPTHTEEPWTLPASMVSDISNDTLGS